MAPTTAEPWLWPPGRLHCKPVPFLLFQLPLDPLLFLPNSSNSTAMFFSLHSSAFSLLPFPYPISFFAFLAHTGRSSVIQVLPSVIRSSSSGSPSKSDTNISISRFTPHRICSFEVKNWCPNFFLWHPNLILFHCTHKNFTEKSCNADTTCTLARRHFLFYHPQNCNILAIICTQKYRRYWERDQRLRQQEMTIF